MRIGTGGTPTEDRQVGAIEPETPLVAQPAFEIVGEGGRGIDDSATVVAHHVDVIVLGRPEGGRPVVEVGVPHEPELLEQFEGAVDRGQIDLGDRVEDLCGVTRSPRECSRSARSGPVTGA